jgi:hypothetical protein
VSVGTSYTPAMDPDRFSRVLDLLRPDEVAEVYRAVALFERVGIWTAEEAAAWREAIRAKAAELSEPVAEA